MKAERYSHRMVLFGWRTLYEKLRTSDSELDLTFFPTSKVLTKNIFNKIGDQTLDSVIFVVRHIGIKVQSSKTIEDIEREIDALLENLRPPKVIFISSAAVYGFRDDKTRGYSENEELNDKTPYAKEKFA